MTRKRKRQSFIAALVALFAGLGGITAAQQSGNGSYLGFAHTGHGHNLCTGTNPCTTATFPLPTTTTAATTTSSGPTTTVPPGSTPRVGHPEDTGALICGASPNTLLDGPPNVGQIATFDPSAPATVVSVPAGNNLATYGNSFNLTANRTYYLAAGVHTFGSSAAGAHLYVKSGDVLIGAPGAILDGSGVQQFAIANAPQSAPNVTVEYLEIRNFNAPDDQGTINQDTNDGWTIRHNYVHDNHGGGLMGGNGESVTYNCLKNNGQYGFNFYQSPGSATPAASLPPNIPGGSSIKSLTLSHNEIVGNNTELLDHPGHPGPGASGGGKFWNDQNATVTNNYVHDNHGTGLWADTDNNGFKVEGNYISGNEFEGFWYEISYNMRLDHNLFLNNNWFKGPKESAGFPDGAIYISESGGDARVANSFGYQKIEIDHNNLVDNWSGITVWANPDRFCPNGLPDTKYCTMGNVSGASPATHTSCATSYILTAPGIDDCRWKAANVDVHDNTFSLTPSHVTGTNPDYPTACTFSQGCGFNAIFSKNATTSPYCDCGGRTNANLVEDQMSCAGWLSGGTSCGSSPTNRFHANSYVGAWEFEVHEQGAVIHWAAWIAQADGPAGNGSNRHSAQDAGSTCGACA